MATRSAKSASTAKEDTPSPVENSPAPQDSSVYVRAVRGDILHLFNNTLITGNPVKMTIDGFLQSQIDAGKVEVVRI